MNEDSPRTAETPDDSKAATSRDGQLDVAQYSTAQLRDLQYTIDRGAFPRNYENITAELERRAQGAADDPEARQTWPVRYTSRDGLLGWIAAKRNRLKLYGEGAIELRAGAIVLRGYQRTWLGAAAPSELPIDVDNIQNVARHDDVVRFEQLRPRRRIHVFTAKSADDAAAIVAALPTLQTAPFARQWADVRDFNDRLRAAGTKVRATPVLVLLNVGVFIAMAVSAQRLAPFDLQQLVTWGANSGAQTASGDWWRLATALFLHANLAHLFVNIWALWNVGRLTERLYGTAWFATLYLGSGVLANLASTAWDPTLVSVGASGAIFGLFGLLLAYLAHGRTRVPATIVRAHWVSTIAFVAFNLVNGALTPGIDNAAHVGGLLSGLALGWLLSRPLESDGRAPLRIAPALLALVLVAAALVGGVRQVADPSRLLAGPEHYRLTHAWYLSGETQNLRTWVDLASRAAAGSISADDLSRGFERDVIPFWKESVERFKTQDAALTGTERNFGVLVADFAQRRLAWAEAIVQAVRSNAPTDVQRAVALSLEADAALARIERIDMRTRMENRRRALVNNAAVVRLKSLLGLYAAPCIESPYHLMKPVAASDSQTDGPAMRDAEGCAAQRAFRNSDFAMLERMLTPSKATLADLPDGGSSLQGAAGGLVDLFESGKLTIQDVFARTADWRHAYPESAVPDLVEVMALNEWAWSVRGFGYATSVSQQAWAVFAHRTAMAAAALADLEPRAEANPLWFDLSLRVGLDQSIGLDRLRAIFDRGVEHFPDYGPLYRQMLRALMPRWGGSYEGVTKFIGEVTRRAGDDRRPELYARLYWNYATLEGDDVDAFGETHAYWEAMRTGFERLRRAHPNSDYLLNVYASSACRASNAETYGRLRPQLEKHLSASAWSDKYSVTGCDARIAEILREARAHREYVDPAGSAAGQEPTAAERKQAAAQVEAAMQAAEPMRAAATRYITEHKHLLPPSVATQRFEFRRVETKDASIIVGGGGAIEVTLKGGLLDGRDFSWVPMYQANSLKWICAKGHVPAQYFGPSCK